MNSVEELDVSDERVEGELKATDYVSGLQQKVTDRLLTLSWTEIWRKGVRDSSRRMLTLYEDSYERVLKRAEEEGIRVVRLTPSLFDEKLVTTLTLKGYIVGLEWSGRLDGYKVEDFYGVRFVTFDDYHELTISRFRDMDLKVVFRASTLKELYEAVRSGPDLVELYMTCPGSRRLLDDAVKRFPDISFIVSGMAELDLLDAYPQDKVQLLDVTDHVKP